MCCVRQSFVVPGLLESKGCAFHSVSNVPFWIVMSVVSATLWFRLTLNFLLRAVLFLRTETEEYYVVTDSESVELEGRAWPQRNESDSAAVATLLFFNSLPHDIKLYRTLAAAFLIVIFVVHYNVRNLPVSFLSRRICLLCLYYFFIYFLIRPLNYFAIRDSFCIN